MNIWQSNPDLCIFLFGVFFAAIGFVIGKSIKRTENQHELWHAYQIEDDLHIQIHLLQKELAEVRSDFRSLISSALDDECASDCECNGGNK